MKSKGYKLKGAVVLAIAVTVFLAPATGWAEDVDSNEPGILEPVSSHLQGRDIRMPNTDQSVDGVEQSNIKGDAIWEDALTTTSMLGHPILHVSSPNEDMRLGLQAMATAALASDQAGMDAAAAELRSILLGTTEGRIYDGFGMLNFNRWLDPSIGAESFPADAVPGEYKMKLATDTGETYISPYDGETRKIWEIDINMLYYDGQIDADTFLVKIPIEAHEDDVLHVNYRIFSLVLEDFSPTAVMLDRRVQLNTVQFPFKGQDSVWVAFDPGQVLNVTVKYTTVRQVRGVYTWGWRVHPPRIQFLQPVYEIENQLTGAIELDPQGESFAFRNREELTLDTIAPQAPEMKMLAVVEAVESGAAASEIADWLTHPNKGPKGTWIDWADLALNQQQLPAEAWEMLADEDGLTEGDYGPYRMVSVYMNNEMYGQGPFLNEVPNWTPFDKFSVKLINFDDHTHYFRNVDFSARLHDDIARCCGGGETSFEIMNFKPTFGAPKVAEMQWRAGWGFRPHFNMIQQQNVFPRGRDRTQLKPFTGGFGGHYYGFQYSEETRVNDFRFNPPPFIVSDLEGPDSLRDADGEPGLVLGTQTPGYGNANMCPQDPLGDFCQTDFGPTNPNGALNWPEPGNPDVPKTELRFPPFLRNPDQNDAIAGDIIPPTGAWRPYLWINPYTGSLYIDPDDPSKGHWADLTYSHGAPVFAGQSMVADIESPRASGQLFYQFDDLFHDNSIFSPHPLPTGADDKQIDNLRILRARARGAQVRLNGRVQRFEPSGDYAPWVSLYDGAAGEKGCEGSIVAVAETDDTGRYRVGATNAGISTGDTICVQSTIGGFDEIVVQ